VITAIGEAFRMDGFRQVFCRGKGFKLILEQDKESVHVNKYMTVDLKINIPGSSGGLYGFPKE